MFFRLTLFPRTLPRSQFSRFVKISCCRCVKCGSELSGGLGLIKCGGCGSFQPAPPTRAELTCCPDYYRLLLSDRPIPRFDIDLKKLKGEFLKLQAAVHPDKLYNDGVGQSWSSWINRAHETLKDPLQRAIYLVSLYEKQNMPSETGTGTEMIDEGHHDISLVLEVREELDSTSDPFTLSQIKHANDERIQKCCKELETIFGEGTIVDLGAARRCINRLRYWMSIERELKEKLYNSE